ncbi:MAG: SlyX family protein [Litorilituus sp.]|jgi:SlyX protein|nr:SlyX family protein [Litorilituus sp.]
MQQSNTEEIRALEERIIALESRNLFQDDAIEQLNKELTIHQAQMVELKMQIQLVANRLKDAGNLSSAKEEVEPPPPHY